MSLSTSTIAIPGAGVRPHLSESFGWRRLRSNVGELWLKGHLLEEKPAGFLQRLAAAGFSGAEAEIAAADGNFAIVFIANDWAVAATDKVSTVPICFAASSGSWVVGSEARRVAAACGCNTVDVNGLLALSMAGYTIGRTTLYRSLEALDPGEIVLFSGRSDPVRKRYYVYSPSPIPQDDVADGFVEATRRVFAKLTGSLDGRPVLIPLSAGLDSRLIASGLHEAGYDNVKCFSYGQVGNHEARAGRQIAEALGFPWTFIPNTPRQQYATFNGPECASFTAFADTLQAVPFQQDFHAVGELKRCGYAPSDSVFVNGQSGDFISGNHIPRGLDERLALSPDKRKQRLFAAMLDRHFSLWPMLRTPEHTARITALLERDLAEIGLEPAGDVPDYAVFEASEFKNRQSKYVVAGQRSYEWHGFEWRLPLWDSDYLDFWSAVPPGEKIGQKLYRDTLRRLNWGNVWGDDFWPERTITPRWMRLPRFVAKVAHAPFGRSAWHRFERRYIAWLTDPVCNYAITSYREVAGNPWDHRNAVSWHVRRYLADKGLTFDDLYALTSC